MSKKHIRSLNRYRHPRRSGIKFRGASPWSFSRPWWKVCLSRVASVAAIILIGAIAIFAQPKGDGTPYPTLFGAISFRAVGSWQIGGTFTTSPTITIPAGATTGDLMVAVASWKDFSVTASITGWTEVTEFADGAVAQGNGTGSMKVAAWYKEHDGSESNPTITWSTTPNISGGTMIVFQKGGSDTWNAPAFATAAISLATNWTATASSDPGITGGDVVIGLVGFRDDSATMTRGATTGLDCAGITWAANYVEAPATHGTTTSANDCSMDLGYRIASSGNSSAAPTMAGTLSADETGAALFIRIRVTAGGGGGGGQPYYLRDQANAAQFKFGFGQQG